MKKTSFCLLLLTCLLAADAQAYLDPGTGSMLLQVILGGIAAVGVAFRIFWHRIKLTIGLGKKPVSGADTE